MKTKDLTTELKAKAFELGFHAVGVTLAKPLAAAEHALLERTRAGLLKDYGFSPETASHFAHPGEALPGAKSVVVVALSYFTRADREMAHVARFARGEDYHKVVKRRLKELSEWLLERVAGAKTMICVDTGPVLDRALAREAGVGSFGKNTLIRTPGRGSWVVLGEMLTDVELEPDQPADLDECGSCDVCLKSCPTGGIVAPYVIDANRCISHLTQMKGYIPRELRPFVGDRIYGCDICQEVCPKNIDAQETDVPEFLLPVRPGLRPALTELLNISPEDFNRLIKPTAVGWIKRSRLRRNVAVALGNLGDPEAVSGLVLALSDSDSVLRAHTAWALGRIGTPAAEKALRAALEQERDPRVKEEILAALAEVVS